MKELAVLALIVALILAGWNHPFSEYFHGTVPPAASPAPEKMAAVDAPEPRAAGDAPQPRVAPPVSRAATPAPDISWMWQAHPMDRNPAPPKKGGK